MNKKLRIIDAFVIVASLCYLWLMLTAPKPPAAPGFEIGETARIIIVITFLAPTFLIWYFGLRAGIFLYEIGKKSGENRGLLVNMSYGVLALIIGLIVSGFLSQARTYTMTSPDYYRSYTIIINYLYIIFPLIGFFMILRATKSISHKIKNLTTASILTALFSVLWLAILFSNSTRQTSTVDFLKPSFYISDFLIILTIVLPTIISWFMGILGSLNLSLIVPFSTKEGARGFSKILYGLWLCLFSSMFLDGLISIGAERLIGTGLGGILIIIYLFVLLLLIAYLLLAKGARLIYSNSLQ